MRLVQVASEPSGLVLTLSIVDITPAFVAGASVDVRATLTNNTPDTISALQASTTTPQMFFSGSPSPLAPTASTVFQSVYTVTAADVASGSISLTAIFTANIDGTSDTIDSNEDTATAP